MGNWPVEGFEKRFVSFEIWYNEYISIASKYPDLARRSGQGAGIPGIPPAMLNRNRARE
jgi:hypothetical protein